MKTKMHVYEYEIKEKRKTYTGSYTVIAGCEKEKDLKQKLKSHLIQEFEFERPMAALVFAASKPPVFDSNNEGLLRRIKA